jgi:hypothetical protein
MQRVCEKYGTSEVGRAREEGNVGVLPGLGVCFGSHRYCELVQDLQNRCRKLETAEVRTTKRN